MLSDTKGALSPLFDSKLPLVPQLHLNFGWFVQMSEYTKLNSLSLSHQAHTMQNITANGKMITLIAFNWFWNVSLECQCWAVCLIERNLFIEECVVLRAHYFFILCMPPFNLHIFNKYRKRSCITLCSVELPSDKSTQLFYARISAWTWLPNSVALDLHYYISYVRVWTEGSLEG